MKKSNVPSLEREKPEQEEICECDHSCKEEATPIEFSLSDPKTYVERLDYIIKKGKAIDTKLLNLNNELLDIKNNKDIIETKIFNEVNSETIEVEIKGEKKIKDKFTNKESREAETRSRLSQNPEFSLFLKQEAETHKEIQELRSELMWFDKEMKAINFVIKLHEIRLI